MVKMHLEIKDFHQYCMHLPIKHTRLFFWMKFKISFYYVLIILSNILWVNEWIWIEKKTKSSWFGNEK